MEYYDLVDKAQGTSTYTSTRSGSGDEMHIVVVDEDGGITGTGVEVLEVYDSVSKGSDVQNIAQGDTNYYVDVIYNHHNTSTGWITMRQVQIGVLLQ